MKLKDNAFKLQSTEEAGFYARALRVIGQDLTDLFPERLEIEKQGDREITLRPAVNAPEADLSVTSQRMVGRNSKRCSRRI
jgi:hypothetical protein